MPRPVIGITCATRLIEGHPAHYLYHDYAEGITQAGGIPLLIARVGHSEDLSEIIDRLDGIVFSGGGDIEPTIYQQEAAPSTEVDPLRDELELPLARLVLEADIPSLWICRGIQVLNVVAGGDLIQDIPTMIPGAFGHSQTGPRWEVSHTVSVAPQTRLADLWGGSTELTVNSFHHQSVGRVAPGFVVSAQSSDGVVEGLESRNHFFAVGMQWHPERLWRTDTATAAMFCRFVQVCS